MPSSPGLEFADHRRPRAAGKDPGFVIAAIAADVRHDYRLRHTNAMKRAKVPGVATADRAPCQSPRLAGWPAGLVRGPWHAMAPDLGSQACRPQAVGRSNQNVAAAPAVLDAAGPLPSDVDDDALPTCSTQRPTAAAKTHRQRHNPTTSSPIMHAHGPPAPGCHHFGERLRHRAPPTPGIADHCWPIGPTV